jgi:hypothetical protein
LNQNCATRNPDETFQAEKLQRKASVVVVLAAMPLNRPWQVDGTMKLLKFVAGICIFWLGLFLTGCSSEGEKQLEPPKKVARSLTSKPIELVFLTREGCVNTPVLLESLTGAAQIFEPPLQYVVVDQGTLLPGDARTGYPTPTILFDDRDLFGLTQPSQPFPAPS